MDELIGKAFGPYTILEIVGEGGMAVVYKGYQESLNRYVAIKVLRRELAHDTEFVTRFQREALAVAKLSHPNILHVYDSGVAHGVYYIVMDYIDGGSLKELIAQGPLDVERAISIAAQLADALDHAHGQGFVHRDVKPSNVLMTREGRPQLTDFGISKAFFDEARMTRTGISIGTPEYMAPEQAQGQSVDGRTDVYALGLVLYEMLTGWVPFSAHTPVAVLYKQVNEAPPPLRQVNANVPAWLEAVTDRALAKAPDARYQHAAEFAELLRDHRTPERLKRRARTGPDGTLPTSRSIKHSPNQRLGVQRNRNLVRILQGIIVALLLVLVGAGIYLLLSGGGQEADFGVSAALLTQTSSPAPTQTLVPTFTVAASSTSRPTFVPDTPTPIVLVVTATSVPLPTTVEPAPSPVPTAAATNTATPTPTPRAAPTAKPAASAGQPDVVTDFESFGSWKRGDEANGTFTRSSTQVHQGSFAGKLAYTFSSADNDYVVFVQQHPIVGEPASITAWVYGDGAGHFLNVWIKDDRGEVWQVPLGRVTRTGWQQMQGNLDVDQAWPWAHIDGPDNGQVDYPVSFYALILDDDPDSFTGSGTVYIDDLRASTEIAASPAETGTTNPTVTTPTQDEPPAPAPGGDLGGNIVFTVYNAGIGSYTLYRAKPDGSGLHALADYVHQPDISPNGARIVVDGVGGGKNDLWTLKIDGTDWRQLTKHPDDRFPTWSPNSQIVVFSSPRQGKDVAHLYMNDQPLSTDKTELLIGDYPVLLANWEVAFNGCDYGWGTGANCGLWRVSNGHQPAQITGNPQDIPTDGTGDEVLFLRPDGDNWDIYRTALTGGNPVRLTDSAGRDGPAAFSPDGKTIAFLSERSGTWALYTMTRQGTGVQKRFNLPLGGGYNQASLPWSSERISWGPSPAGPTPMPTEDNSMLPAPQITYPIPDDVVSARKPTVVKWTWSQELGFNQGFEVRFWHTSESTPAGVAPATAETELEVNLGMTPAYRQYGPSTYYLEVVVVQLNPYRVLSKNARIRVKADPNK